MALEPYLIALVLVAALTHASWNALVKTSGDGLFTFTTVMGTGAVIYIFALPFVDFPVAAAWPYLIGSVILHNAYFMLLWYAYRYGDLSSAYPVARGASPLLVAGGAALFVGQTLTPITLTGLVLASAGICLFAFEKGLPRGENLKPFMLAFATGIFIASYTVTDGVGLREVETPFGYIAWLNFLDPVPMMIYVLIRRPMAYVAYLKVDGLKAVIGGLLAMTGYAFVLYALSQGSMAHVSALRETSVLFAVVLGAVTLKERFGPIRWVAAICIVGGVAAMHLSG